MEEDDLPDDDPAVEYWIPFVRRMKNIPMEYQLVIIDEYEKAENQVRDMDIEKMWDLLLAGESEVKLVVGKHWRAN